MLRSIALLLLLGLAAGGLFTRARLPGLLGMILVGILLGPNALDALDDSLMAISAPLRQIALVIILARAGLSLELEDLKQVGRPAVLLCFLPASVELLGTVLLAPKLLGVTVLEGAILGSVLSAVSPAVVVPRMLRLMEAGYGQEHRIPQLILAGASVDDVFVIVVFTALTGLAATGEGSLLSLAEVPVSVLLGLALGCGLGWLVAGFFRCFPLGEEQRVMVVLSVSFLALGVEEALEGVVPVSGLLAILGLGLFLRRREAALAGQLAGRYQQLWQWGEVFLFVLVGATVDLDYVFSAGAGACLLVAGALVFRMVGVALSLLGTRLTGKERLFCMLAYTPKATVQAAIGAIPLGLGLSCGELVLTVAVLAILLTAPFGAIAIDRLYPVLLERSEGEKGQG